MLTKKTNKKKKPKKLSNYMYSSQGKIINGELLMITRVSVYGDRSFGNI